VRSGKPRPERRRFQWQRLRLPTTIGSPIRQHSGKITLSPSGALGLLTKQGVDHPPEQRAQTNVAQPEDFLHSSRDRQMIEIIHGDCLDAMRDMPSNSVTSIVTDPPYALQFMGKGWDKVLPSSDIWREALRVLKPGGIALVFGGTRTYHRLTCSIEDAGFQIRDCLMWLYGSGFPKSHNIGKKVNGWQGYGTALKPAWEPIVLAMKPLKGTFATNALEHGVAGINVDGCRVATDDNLNGGAYGQQGNRSDIPGASRSDTSAGMMAPGKTADVAFDQPAGRWPANVVHDGSDEVLDAFPEAPGQQGDLKANGRDRQTNVCYGKMGPPYAKTARSENTKSASRFFYCAKASKKDRGEGNTHPTVKPLALMQWLVRMVRMPSDTVILDPFMGSGSTGVACIKEGVDFTGIEMNKEYVEISKSRLADASPSTP